MGGEMAQASIFTLEPRSGGVPALARAAYRFLEASGHAPTLVYRATDGLPATRGRALVRLLTTLPVRRGTQDGRRVAAVAPYPVRPGLQYHVARIARRELRAPIAAAVSGSAHAALPLAAAGRPYVLWVATVYRDEVEARAAAGDGWAAELLAGPDWAALERQEALALERASVVLALSPSTRERIAAGHPGVARRLRVALAPVDTERFRAAPREPERPTLLLTARLNDPRKNPGLLLGAFRRVKDRHEGLRLVLAGDEPGDDLRASAADLVAGGALTFAGCVPDADLPDLYRAATLFVLPSRQEGLGISVAEAMASGVPVVATRCGGPESLVEDGRTGRLVANGDEAALAEAVDALLSDAPARRAMGAAARVAAEARFSRAAVEPVLDAAFRDTFGPTLFPER